MSDLIWLDPQGDPRAFPPCDRALKEPAGLLAAGGDLRPERILAAYRRGIFPWYSPEQPILWWSPDPREVLFPESFRRSRSLAKRERQGGWDVRTNSDFAAVIDACAGTRRGEHGTWITPEMRAAYLRLHTLGYAHSIETWFQDELVGGLYGLQIGPVFFGESMFSRRTDASKIALSALVRAAPSRQIALIDCQLPSAHLKSLGSRSLPRSDFLHLLRQLIDPLGGDSSQAERF